MEIEARQVQRAIRACKADFLVVWFGDARILASRAILRDAFGAIPAKQRITLDVPGEFTITEHTNGHYQRRIPAGSALRVQYQMPGVRTCFQIVHEAGWHMWTGRRHPTMEALDLNSITGQEG